MHVHLQGWHQSVFEELTHFQFTPQNQNLAQLNRWASLYACLEIHWVSFGLQ